MGTQVQSETYLMRHCSKRDLNVNMSSGMWPLYDEEKALKNGQINDSSMGWRALMGGYLGHDKEKIPETIIKHEYIFRLQVQELHRLYKRQRDLMYEIKMKELHKHQKKTERSQSGFFSSYISLEDAKRTLHGSHFPSSDSTLVQFPPSGASDEQSPATVMDGKCLLSPFPSQEMGCLEKCESHKSSSNMFHEKPFELEIPVDIHMNKEETIVKGRFCGLVGNGVGCESRIQDPLQDRDLKPSLDSDLNEPIQLVETSLSSSMKSSGNMCCLTKNVQSIAATANSSFRSLHPMTGMDGKNGLKNLLLDGRIGKEQRTYGFKTGQLISDGHPSFRGICFGDSPTDFESFHVDRKIEYRRKRRIFGVEIFEEDDEPSSRSSGITHLNHKSNQLPTLPSSIPSWRTAPSYLGKKVSSSQENHCATSSKSSVWDSDSHLQSLKFGGGAVLNSSGSKKFSSTKNEVPFQNGFCFHPQLDSKLVNGSSSTGFDFLKGKNAVNLVSGQFALHDFAKWLKGVDSTDWKSPKLFKSVSETTNMCQNVSVLEHNPYSANSQSKALPWFMRNPQHNGEKTRGRENSCSMNMDSFQKCSQNFFKKIEITQISSQIVNSKEESNLSTTTEDAQDKKVDCVNRKKILGFQIPEVVSKTDDGDPTGFVSTASCSNGTEFPNQHEANPNALEKGLNNYISGLRHHIDLNLSMNEDETPSVLTLPAALVKIATAETDLEVPAGLESEVSAFDCRETKLSLEESKETHQELIRMAAEAIVSISPALEKDVADRGSCQPLEATSPNCLKWFAEVISSYNSDEDSKIREASGIDGSYDEESIPDGMDYFGFMTLKLKDVKEESFYYKLPNIQNHDDEETTVTTIKKRPQRGQGRRGRHTKDFQRDILPNLVSLSKQELVEDLQTIVQLFRSSGCTWHSSLSQWNGGKNGRGRRRAGGSLPSSVKKLICPPPLEQPICSELGDKCLPGWGKRTRRLPRQRNSKNNHVLPLKF